MDRDGDSPPFWFQPPMTPARSHRRSYSPIINPVVLIILVPILALLLIFFLLPPFLSHASSIFRPNSVKKSWDSINIFLVLFAILCGVLARRNDDTSSTDAGDVTDGVTDDVSFDEKINSSVSNRWFEDSDRKFYSSSVGVPENGVRRLRSSSSYPDLRHESLWETGDNRYRFYDDFEVNLNLHRSADSDSVHHRARRSEISQMNRVESDVKVIPVDTFVNRSSPPRKSPSPPPAPPPPPPPPKNLSRRRTYRSVPKQEKVEKRSENENETEFVEVRTTPPPPPPPPPPGATVARSQHKPEKSDRKKSSATKDMASSIASLYNQTKRKRKHKTRNIYDNATHSPPSTHSVPPPAPPPPPPPPPPSVFHNMFRKGTKSKRIHSLSASVPPPPPPPPPPPGSIFNNLFKNSSKSKRFSATATNSVSSAPPPPPPPPPSSMLNTLFKSGNKSKRFHSTSDSPPPPPPAPPAPVTSNRKSKRRSHIQPPPEAPPPPQPEHSRRRSASSGKPPLPTKASSYYERDEYLNSGGQSPLIPVPPPPPPFKMPDMKYLFRGDFVKISSNQSSRSTSPEREDVGTSSANRSPSPSDGGASIGSGFCPSPDVNIKAATFIARLRDEWRMEKMNSVKEKQKMGPSPGPRLSPN